MTATLREMGEDEFAVFEARSIDSFSEDLARAGSVPLDVAHAQAARQLAALLPAGRATPGHHFENVIVEGRLVGQLWIGPHPEQADAAFVYDIVIHESERGQGFGRAAMRAAEQLARQEGFAAIGLSVFGDNAGAKRLYRSLGYEVVATSMLKRLD